MNETEWAIVGILGWLSFWWILEWFGIAKDGFLIMSILLLVDWVFGIVSSYILWREIKSRTMWVGLVKKVTRWLLPFIVAWALKWTWMPWIEILLTAIIWIIVFSETYSIIWHIYSINTKEELPEIDAFKMLLGKLANFFKKLIEKSAEDIDKEE